MALAIPWTTVYVIFAGAVVYGAAVAVAYVNGVPEEAGKTIDNYLMMLLVLLVCGALGIPASIYLSLPGGVGIVIG